MHKCDTKTKKRSPFYNSCASLRMSNKLENFLPEWFIFRTFGFLDIRIFRKLSKEISGTFRCMKSSHGQPWFRILTLLQLHAINSLTISDISIFFSWKRFTCILFFGKMKKCMLEVNIWKVIYLSVRRRKVWRHDCSSQLYTQLKQLCFFKSKKSQALISQLL